MVENVSVACYSAFEEVSEKRAAWDDFMESVGGEIFLSFDWCRLWWKHYGGQGELRIYWFSCADKTAAILPMFFERLWVGPILQKVIKFVGTEFMPVTVTVPIRKEYLTEVISALTRDMSARWSWDVLHIGNISGRYPDTLELADVLAGILGQTRSVRCRKVEVQTYYEMRDSLEAQIATLTHRQRTKTKRVFKELRDKNISLSSLVSDAASYARDMEEFVSIHQAQWERAGLGGHFADWPEALGFHLESGRIQLDRGRLRLLKVYLDGQCVGYEYMYKFGDSYCWFLSARKEMTDYPRIDFFRIAFGEKVKLAVGEGVRFIDALQGRYEYKLVMGGKLYPIYAITASSAQGLSAIRHLFFRVLAWSLNVAYLKIWRRRLLRKLHLRPGPLWRIWIKTVAFSHFGEKSGATSDSEHER